MGRVLLLTLWCLVALAAVPSARIVEADEDEVPAFGRVLAALCASSAETRRHALSDLERLLPLTATETARVLRPLAEMVRRRPSDEAALAVRLAAALEGTKARRLWIRALDPSADPRVFLAAVEAAGRRSGDPATLRALLEGARDLRRPMAGRALYVEALGAVGGAGARPLLLHPLEAASEEARRIRSRAADDAEDAAGAEGRAGPAEPWLLASARALGLGRLGGRPAVEALLALLEHAQEAPRIHAWEALVALTGTMLPPEAEVWQAWWKAHPDALSPKAAGQAPVPTDARDRYDGVAPAHVPHYYGVPIQKRRSRVVFCLDVSQSMYGRGIEQARGELTRTLLSFPTRYAFDVIAFNERLYPFADALVPAHPVVKARALAWLEALETTSYTNLYDAVEAAFGYGGIGRRAREGAVRIDAVFLLSDGAPNRGRYRRAGKVVSEIAALSGRRIPVHAVAAGEEVFPLLRRIAGVTGGRFVDAFDFE